MIYKILSAGEWAEAQSAGFFSGSEVDVRDGYIHFSSTAQVSETAAKHFAGQPDLVLLSVDENLLGSELKWEVSRGGDLFPHLYGPLQLDAVKSSDSLELGENGIHIFPAGLE